ncbi:uncharacterized protein METZ01_LOCUS283364 [marine metagenome]|uniref:Uncharacterized protein n=1 Tax=marine metagenome TaxID=408172 RepID=A0A382L1D0_9ZZZZ
MKWSDTWGLSEFCNWSILKKGRQYNKVNKKIEAFKLKETIDGRFTTTPENESEYWSLVGQFPVETSTSIPDGEYKLYHETWPYKEKKTPFVDPFKFYADSLVTIKNGHFDVQTVMTAFDQTIRKSKDHSHIYIEELLLDEHGKISAQTGS